MKTLAIRQVAVLGAGVMGAQIAAHFANANMSVLLFDLPDVHARDKSHIAKQAIANLRKLQPAPLATKSHAHHLIPANYDEDLPRLAQCDLIIEAIAERLDWKAALYARIAPHVSSKAIIASNTSGLSVAALAETLPVALRAQFCGIHFFNPPRYMPLVELIPTTDTAPGLLDGLESWLTVRLGKGVVRAKDTPNFIANRVGIFSILAVMHHTAAFGLGFDEADALTGTLIGRPKSATFRTGDVVGLDTLAHVIRTMQTTLTDDPWHQYFQVPGWMEDLITAGHLGQKSKQGVFRKVGKVFEVYDPAHSSYREQNAEVGAVVREIFANNDWGSRLSALRTSEDRQAQFLWAIFRDVFHYCAWHLANIADSARDIDFALRWGFGWAQGPFETWQAAGWNGVAQAVAEDIAQGRALATTAALPTWVLEPTRKGVHGVEGSWSALAAQFVPRSSLAVYQRQIFPENLFGEAQPSPAGETLLETAAVRLWRLPQEMGVGILSFKTKQHVINAAVLEGILQALAYAEAQLDALVLWHEAPFAFGADLSEVLSLAQAQHVAAMDKFVTQFQQVTQALRFATIPVVAGVQGLALGGGCELTQHCAARVLALESGLGLVEAGVGLIPAGGGCKTLALQAATQAATSSTPNYVMAYLQSTFMTLAFAKVSKNALDAVEMGLAKTADKVLFHQREVLWVALNQARALADAGYAPPAYQRAIPVAGRAGIAMLETTLVNLREGGMISAHDYRVARALAVALCGGEIEGGSLVDEAWLLAVEKRLFLELLQTPETPARIAHVLTTGKPLRN